MSIENVRKYINACLYQKTFTPLCDDNSIADAVGHCFYIHKEDIPTISVDDDELVKFIKQYAQDEYDKYDDKYCYTLWFAIRILYTKHFKSVKYADIVYDVLNFDGEYFSAFENELYYRYYNNIRRIDKYCLTRPEWLADYYFICNVHYRICCIKQYCKKHKIILTCSYSKNEYWIPPLRVGVHKQPYTPDPEREITRVLKYLRATDQNERYKIDWYNKTQFDLVDWVQVASYATRRVQEHVRYNTSDNLKVWFAVRLLILNGFKKVTIKQVENMRAENPKEFDKCIDHDETLQDVMIYIKSCANDILAKCNSRGGSFIYNGQVPYSYKEQDSYVNTLRLIMLVMVYIIVLLLVTIAMKV